MVLIPSLVHNFAVFSSSLERLVQVLSLNGLVGDWMAAPAIVVHGGAGAGPERLSNLQPAIEAARRVFELGGDAIQAAVEACVVLEDDPVFNAGTGSVMRNDGSVLTDASFCLLYTSPSPRDS